MEVGGFSDAPVDLVSGGNTDGREEEREKQRKNREKTKFF